MFKSVSSRVSFPDMEANVLKYWKDNNVFRRTYEDRDSAPVFMLYEGPPTANGSPGIHHVLARVFKDVICRHRTMKGYRCVRKGGWDTHGLPVELEIEKELGLSSKREIEEYGIEKFNQKCKDSVFRYVKEWENMTDRIGFWVDMDDPYVTLHNTYIESGWWILKQMWDRELLYEGLRGTPHCPRCGTSLSSHEVALGYRENTPDPSVFPKFLIEPENFSDDQKNRVNIGLFSEVPTYLVAWTTTPWTLPGNTALAVDRDAEYSLIEISDDTSSDRLVLASELVEANVKQDYTVLATFKGADLIGLAYRSLYVPSLFGSEIRQFVKTEGGPTSLESVPSFIPKVVQADFVSMEDGTGIVHIAPAFGDEDLDLGREKGLCFVQPVDLQGIVTGQYPFSGMFFKDSDPVIMDDLAERGLLFDRGVYKHTYPFCWRCDTPLLYYAKSSWYIRTTAVKDNMVEGNGNIEWHPEYIRDGRFGEWLRNNIDWAISRERYWGTPIPIWRCSLCQALECVGSVEELKSLASTGLGVELDDLDLHRPHIDSITLSCSSESCSGTMYRIPEVMDAWFDSGAMPYAQWHYPFENDDIVTQGLFPADYICEAVDQTRGWFYSLHALGTLLHNQPAYKNVICLGLILDGRGRKMSKRIGNVVEPNSILDVTGADALRWYLFTASHPGEPRRFSDKLVNETLRRVLLTLWNVYSFFVNYATIDNFSPKDIPDGWKPENELDRWILSELNVLVNQVDTLLEDYNPTDAGRRIQEFIDGLSNWYVRRSRRRFWRSENDSDKISAYATLYNCLCTTSKLMAPLAPFIAEEMYQNLVKSVDDSVVDSVHLADFPESDASLIDESLMEATRLAMKVSSMGRAARSKAGLKVRQPLSTIAIKTRNADEEKYLEWVTSQVLEELNVKEIVTFSKIAGLLEKVESEVEKNVDVIVSIDTFSVAVESGYMVALDSHLSESLIEEGLARELAHRIQNMRKDANFDLTDRIIIYYEAPDAVASVISNYGDYISQETLSDSILKGKPEDPSGIVAHTIDGMEVSIAVKKA